MRSLWGRQEVPGPYILGGRQSQDSGPRHRESSVPLSSQATQGLLAMWSGWPWAAQVQGVVFQQVLLPQGTVFTGLFTFLDVNECAANTHTCSLHATCLNILGSFKCKCKQGYKGSGLQCSGKYTWPWCLSYSHKAFSPRLLPPFFLPPTLCVWRHGGGEVHTYSV